MAPQKVVFEAVSHIVQVYRKKIWTSIKYSLKVTEVTVSFFVFRCVRITDTGLGYLSTMSSLRSLYLRWCCQVITV